MTSVSLQQWERFLASGFETFSSLEQDGKDGILRAESIGGDGANAIILDREKMASRMAAVLGVGDGNLSMQVLHLVNGWIKRRTVSPRPTSRQLAWVRWLLIKNANGSNIATTRRLITLLSGSVAAPLTATGHIELLAGVAFQSAAVKRDGYLDQFSSYGEPLEAFNRTVVARRNALRKKVIRYKRNQVFNPDHIPMYEPLPGSTSGEMRPYIAAERTAREKLVSGGNTSQSDSLRLIRESQFRESTHIFNWDAQQLLEASIKSDPYLISVCRSEVKRQIYFDRLAGAGAAYKHTAEERAAYEKERLSNVIHYEPSKDEQSPLDGGRPTTKANEPRSFGRYMRHRF